MPTVDRRPLLAYLRLQRAADREVMRHLSRASANIDGELRRLQASSRVGDAVRREQLLRSQIAIRNELARYWQSVGQTIAANEHLAAAAGAQQMLAGTNTVMNLFSVADRAYMMSSVQESAQRGIETLRERVSGSSHVPLAQSVYDNAALSQGKVDTIINNALARGASAAELARDVRAYVNPNTPGGVRYASLRLGRTELNNAFHASQVRQAQETPWITGVLWHLSGSHPRPDECNEYADSQHYEGGDAGVFLPDEVPAKPHPNCLCFTTPETPSRDEFIKRFHKGEYDTYLDEEFPDLKDKI